MVKNITVFKTKHNNILFLLSNEKKQEKFALFTCTKFFRSDYRNGGGGDRYRDSGRRGGYDDRRGGGYGDRRGGGGYGDRSRGGGGRPRNHEARENPRPSNCLGIFGMSMNTSERDLREIFERFGPVDSVKVIMDHETGRSRGFGFVNFEERSDATKAREKITETMIDGMTVRVDYAIQNRAPPRNRSPDARRRSPPSSRARYSRSPSR